MNLPSRTEFFGACWSHYFAITVLAHLDCHCRSKGFVMNPTQPKTLRPQPKTLRPGFTILEVVVVIAVISVLMAILVPAVQSARESSRRISCQNNLRQLGLALACTAEQSGTFPVGQIASKPFVELLPFLEQTALFNRLRSNIRGDVDLLPVFCCPSDPVIWAKNKARYGDTSYLLNRGTLFPAGSKQLGETNGFVVSPLENTRPADISQIPLRCRRGWLFRRRMSKNQQSRIEWIRSVIYGGLSCVSSIVVKRHLPLIKQFIIGRQFGLVTLAG